MLYSQDIYEELRIAALHRKHFRESVARKAADRAAAQPCANACGQPREELAATQLSQDPPAISVTAEKDEPTITEPFMLRNEGERIAWTHVARAACIFFSPEMPGISIADLQSSSRSVRLVFIRQIVMYLMHSDVQHAGEPYSMTQIGRRLGNRDHTTVLHGIRKIEKLLAQDESLRCQLAAIRRFYL